jgi:hypothetical protein
MKLMYMSLSLSVHLGASFCITWNKHNFGSYIILYIELNGDGGDDEDAALLMMPRARGGKQEENFAADASA